MSTISTPVVVPQTGVPQTNTERTGSTTTTTQSTGTGTVGQTGQVPDPEMKRLYEVVTASLSKLMPTLSSDDISTLISEIIEKLKDLRQASDNEKYKIDTNDKRAALAEKKDKAEEAIKKLKEAEELRAALGIFATILTIIMAAITGGILGFLGAVGTETAKHALGDNMDSTKKLALNIASFAVAYYTGNGMEIFMKAEALAMNAAELMGADKTALQYADMAIKTAVGIAMIVGALVMPQKLAEAASQIAKTAAQIIMQVMAVVQALATVAETSVGAAASIISADAKMNQAKQKEMEALVLMLDALIDEAIQRMMAAGDLFNAMIDSIVETNNDRAQTIGRTQFSA